MRLSKAAFLNHEFVGAKLGGTHHRLWLIFWCYEDRVPKEGKKAIEARDIHIPAHIVIVWDF